MPLLKAQHLNTGYGKKQILHDVSLSIEEGETVALFGGNGSGKSTLLKALYGLLPLWKGTQIGKQGKISFQGEEITHQKPHHRIQNGMVYIPQKEELFYDLTVQDNLEVSTSHQFSGKKAKVKREEVFERFPMFKLKRRQLVNNLSGGERKLLSLGMAIMNTPKFLMIDEPLAGLSPENIQIVLEHLLKFKKSETAMIIIEHRTNEVKYFSDRYFHLEFGRLRETNIMEKN